MQGELVEKNRQVKLNRAQTGPASRNKTMYIARDRIHIQANGPIFLYFHAAVLLHYCCPLAVTDNSCVHRTRQLCSRPTVLVCVPDFLSSFTSLISLSPFVSVLFSFFLYPLSFSFNKCIPFIATTPKAHALYRIWLFIFTSLSLPVTQIPTYSCSSKPWS